MTNTKKPNCTKKFGITGYCKEKKKNAARCMCLTEWGANFITNRVQIVCVAVKHASFLPCELQQKAPACFLLRGFPTLGHLKALYLYLDFPLRCMSLGHGGTEQQKGERGSCSVALWLTEEHSGGFKQGWLTLPLLQGFPVWLREAQTFCVFSVRDCAVYFLFWYYCITNALMQHALLWWSPGWPFKAIPHGYKLYLFVFSL